MLVTEAEAKTKWCPQPGLDKCLASNCMAWRDGGTQRETIRNYHVNPEVFPDYRYGSRRYPDGWQYSHTDHENGAAFDVLHRPKPDASPVGYCGLAGRVE